jgi:uncharacterized membrane protein
MAHAHQSPESSSGDGMGRGATADPSPLGRMAVQLEGDSRWDGLADGLGQVVEPLAGSRAGRMLRGDWLGHALHPLLTDFPLGCWLASGLLDVVGGRPTRVASRRLVGLGLLFTGPTVAAGLAEFAEIEDRRLRRVAAAHAAGNTAVAFLYLRSWVARRRGHHLVGIGWALSGGALAWVTGYLGGHLSFGRSVGTGLRGDGQTPSAAAAAPEDGSSRGRHLIDIAQASELLHVPVEQVRAMVDEGLLVAAGGSSEPVFHEQEVRSVGLLGG